MGRYTLRLVDCAPTQLVAPEDDLAGWHVAVQGHDQGEGEGDEEAGTQISIMYPFDNSVEKNLRWYLEPFPEETPWELRKASLVQKQIDDYAIGIFRQLQILHSIGISPDIDTIVIEVSDRNAGATPSNIFRLHWEVLESPKVWDELWAIAFPPKLLRNRKPIPRVMIRRVISQQGQFGHNNGGDWADDDDGDLSDESGRIVTGSFIRSYQSDGRRSILQDQKVQYDAMGMASSLNQQIHIKLSLFRILLVVARRIKTEKNTRSQANKSTRGKKKAPDLDPSLISEPLLEAIDQLSESLDVRLDVCRPGSWTALQSLLEQKGEGYYDLVHFDLHGDVLQPKGAGLNFLSPETQSKRKKFGELVFTPAHEIGTVLREAGVLMVALNACETGREDPVDAQTSSTEEQLQNTADDQHAGGVNSALGLQINLAKTFVKCGVPSVLAMSHKITASFVTVFYKSFYNALLKTKSDVCEAVSIARQSLISQKIRTVGFGLEVELEDWIIPVLYQSHTVTFDIVSAGEIGSARPSVAENQHVEKVPTREKLFRRMFNRDSSDVRGISPRQIMPAVPQNTNRMLGRGLEVLYVEALLLSSHSRRTLFLSGKYGIGKTHFVKGLGDSWALTGCISRKPVYIDCSLHPDWKAVDVLGAIVRRVTELDLAADSIEKAKTSLRHSQELVIIDNVEPENLSSEVGAVDALHGLQEFIQSLDGGTSLLIIVSREDLGQSGILDEETEDCAQFWQLSERGELAVQEVTLDMLRNLRQSPKLNSKYETRDMRRFLNCLDFNPQLITLFLKAMSTAGQLSNMAEAFHTILFSVVQLPLDDPESRMVRVAQKTFTNLGRLDNGDELQKLLLCLAQFSIFIPCGLHDEVFFPSAKCYLGYLRVCQVLEWPSSADASIVQPGVELSEVPSQMHRQLSELAKESIDPFCVLIEQLIDSDLVEFTRQSLQNKESHTAIDNYYEGPSGTDSTKQLLMKLNYLRINPTLTQYLRFQFGEGTSGPSHGLSQTRLLIAFCAYYKSFSISRWDEYASHQSNGSQPLDTTATAESGAFTSDSVYLHDASNIYSSVHIALALPHPTMRWMLLPFNVLNDLMSTAMRTFNPHIIPYKPLPTGFLTEETIISLLRAVTSYYEDAPRAERESPTPLRIAATLSLGMCCLMFYVGQSAYSDIDVYHREIKSCIKGASKIMQKRRTKYGSPGEPPSTNERYLIDLLDHISTQDAHDRRVRRLVGLEEIHEDFSHEVRENNLFALAIRGGLKVTPRTNT